ncbi:ECs1072 family phage-associated protein [Xenorhabdus stockiae]|uniref:ECs1072 family phage-associated protein n=1 Tax=Xenorhabdus stockiae TaxID=351614 RepID=UPI0040632B37
MSNYSDLWNTINRRIFSVRSIKVNPLITSFSQSAEQSKVFLRTLQIFILEDILRQHREKYATIFEPLNGEKALNHKIFIKTGNNIGLIKSMSLEDKILTLQDEIKIKHLSPEAKRYTEIHMMPDVSITFDNFLPEEWEHEENKIFLAPLEVDIS